ncbi:MAG TPA: HAMP domain-containing sensor histidine kinase [Gemmataceae bacterium]|nr:HAMP domain-containing sensor histidine kinase [Gemmataceae bacterium]
MTHAPADGLTVLDRGLDLMEEVLLRTNDPGARAAGIAETLRSLVPDALLYACRLTRDGQSHTVVVDRAGVEQKDVAPEELSGASGGRRWVAQDLGAEGGHGLLAVALPEQADADLQAPKLLALCARHLARCLDLETARRERSALEVDLGEQTWLANLGLLGSPVMHEFNNFLNVALLQVAVLEQEFPGVRRAEFRVIRQQGKTVAELVRQWQQYRHRQQIGPRPLDLNTLVRQTVEAITREEPGFGEARIGLAAPDGTPPGKGGVWVKLSLAAELPPVLGTALDAQRLIRFLVTNAAAAITTLPGFISIRTELTGGKVVLTIEDTGPTVAPEMLAQVFEPLVSAREGPNRLEMAVCRMLAQRRLQGGIVAENRPSGLAVIVTLKPCT